MTMTTNQCENHSSSASSAMETNEEIDLSMQPAVRKVLKPEVQEKLLRRAVMSIVPENPIGALHTLFEKESFNLTFYGNNKIHKAVLRIDGRVFEKVSTQKRKARDGVVIDALECLFANLIIDMKNRSAAAVHAPLCAIPTAVVNPPLKSVPRTHKLPANDQDDVCAKKVKHNLPNRVVSAPLVKKELKPAVVARLVQQALGLLDCDNPNTVTALFSLYEKDVFSFEVIDLNQNDLKFQAKLRVGDRWYTECATSIKKAKSLVTKKALRDLFPEYAGLACSDSASGNVKTDTNGDNRTENEIELRAMNGNAVIEDVLYMGMKSACFADFIANTVESKYSEIVAQQPEHLRRFSVLSGIVMIQNNDCSTASVISVSTGNKCLPGDKVTTNGDVLFDCHAEILSKRCLVAYIYRQLVLAVTTDNETILESGDRGLLRVKANVKFYLYISSSPCGDGRVFSFAPAKNPDRKKLAVKRGMLRVKLESGMGGIPVTEHSDTNTTYDGYLRGKPLVLMCCSAKLLRANVVGIQGALLASIIEPVYFDGVLIGDIFHKDNLTRALYGRLRLSEDAIPPPYRLNKPLVAGITDSKIATNVKPGKSCMNWVICDPVVEFISTKTGKTCDDRVSRLCKLNLFKQYVEVLTQMKKVDLSSVSQLVYQNCKESVETYQRVKRMFFEDMENSFRGKWIVKPKELNCFSVANCVI